MAGTSPAMTMGMDHVKLIRIVIALTMITAEAHAQSLPGGFVYLRDIDPGIIQDIRYASSNNFVGRPLAGYGAGECVVKREVGLRLKAVQQELAAQGLSLKMFDCYRPARASLDMVRWSQNGHETAAERRYNPKIPKSERKRTLVFPLTSGHFASPWVPSIRGVIEKHPDIIKRAVAAITVEHLGCREWMDNASMKYGATGKNEWSVAITPDKAMGRALVDALQGSRDRAGVVNPVNGGWLGEGSSLSRAGIPTIGYIPQPNYLLAGPADGCIEKLDPALLHSQIQVFARLLHAIETMTAVQLKGA